jgi:membrane protease YdiL (CAAX protease family)
MESEPAPGPIVGSGEAESPPPSGRRLVQLALIFYSALWVIALVWRVGLQGQPLWRVARDVEVHWIRDGALGVLAATAVIQLSAELTRRTRAGERLARALARAVGGIEGRQGWLLALASGVAEEAFFRGALQPVTGLWIASLLFAAAHFVPRRDLLPWSAFSLAAGLLLGGLYELTGSLVAPTVAHVVVNGVNLDRLVREHGGQRVDSRGNGDGG